MCITFINIVVKIRCKEKDKKTKNLEMPIYIGKALFDLAKHLIFDFFCNVQYVSLKGTFYKKSFIIIMHSYPELTLYNYLFDIGSVIFYTTTLVFCFCFVL